MSRRPSIAVLFGGRSPEHWVSFKSGLFVLTFLDRSRYDVEAVYVEPDGTFASAPRYLAVLDRFLAETPVVLFDPEDGVGDWRGRLEAAAGPRSQDFAAEAARGAYDLVFPVFHGRYGEDGTIQGLARVLGLPYAGCSFEASALGMDKILTKRIAAAAGLAVAPYREVHRDQWESDPADLEAQLAADLGWPMFVKPARLGSSIGVGRAVDPATLRRALTEACPYDYRVLVESEVRGIEYAVGVLSDGITVETSVVAEYTSQPENFDYDSKYGAQALEDIIPARLSPADTERLLTFTRAVATSLHLRGISRIDSFWGPDGPILNEVNTMPGLNARSPFVVAWGKAGVGKRELVDRMVALALGPGLGTHRP